MSITNLIQSNQSEESKEGPLSKVVRLPESSKQTPALVQAVGPHQRRPCWLFETVALRHSSVSHCPKPAPHKIHNWLGWLLACSYVMNVFSTRPIRIHLWKWIMGLAVSGWPGPASFEPYSLLLFLSHLSIQLPWLFGCKSKVTCNLKSSFNFFFSRLYHQVKSYYPAAYKTQNKICLSNIL